LAYKQIKQIGAGYQGGLPSSCVWTELVAPREDIEVTILKVGQGIYVRYGHRNSSALNMSNLPEQVRAELPLGWSVSFGTSANPLDGELTERMFNITARLDLTATRYEFPWQVHLVRTQLRTGEFGTPAAIVYRVEGSWDDCRCPQSPPMCAKEMPTFIESSRPKESQALLRFGRDSNWPPKVTVATTASPCTTLATTYDIDWSGIECTEEGEISASWCWGSSLKKRTWKH
jgi:hypothetical protein